MISKDKIIGNIIKGFFDSGGNFCIETDRNKIIITSPKSIVIEEKYNSEE